MKSYLKAIGADTSATAVMSVSKPRSVERMCLFWSSTNVMNINVTKATVYCMPLMILRKVRPPRESPKSPFSTNAGGYEVAYQLG